MTILYSPSTGGFYDSGLHEGNLPADAREVTVERYNELLIGQGQGQRIIADEAGDPVLADQLPPSTEHQQKALECAVQAHLDAGARELGYDSIATAVSYAGEAAVPKFQTEGRALRAWRSKVWAACYELLGAVQAGQRAVPDVSELIEELPALELAQ